jgi:acetoin utilization protein AcuA
MQEPGLEAACPFPEVRDRCTPDFLAGMTIDPGIGAFGRYAPEAGRRQLAALTRVASLALGRVLVAHVGRHLVGYLTFHPPPEDSRWASLPPGQILELGGIEVARGLRGRGVARRLMDAAFASGDYQAALVYAQGLTWCWDMTGSRMGVSEYRAMVLRLFEAFGFRRCVTDDPDVTFDRTSVLLVRIGREASAALVQAFQAQLVLRDR